MERIKALSGHFVPSQSSVQPAQAAATSTSIESIVQGLPGPWELGHPKFGHGKVLQQAVSQGKFHRLIEQWATQYGPIFGYYTFEEQPGGKARAKVLRIVLTDPGETKRLLKDNLPKIWNYEKSILLGKGVVSVHDLAEWEWQRKTFKQVVSSESIRQLFFPIIVNKVKELIGHLAHSSLGRDSQQVPVDVHHPLMIFAFSVIANALLGEDLGFQADVASKLSDAFSLAMEKEMAGKDFNKDPEFHEAKVVIDAFIAEAIQRYEQREPGQKKDAFISTILAKDPTGCPIMTRTLQRDNISTFLIAGHDTSAHSMSWAILELSRNPEMQKKMQKEIDDLLIRKGGLEKLLFADYFSLPYLLRVLEESMRLWPVVSNGTYRELTEDTKILGRTIPKGAIVNFPAFFIQRDPKTWGTDAATFNPERTWHRDSYIPFSGAPRDCLGRNVAMLEMRIVLVHLYGAFTTRLADPNEVVDDFNAITLYPKKGVKVYLERRK